jgi:AAA15 family ATPase/GTPase
MIIEFTVGNFRSIRHKQTLSLQAAPIVSEDPDVDERNVFTVPGGLKLLKSVAIFGPNASGKSNFLKALTRMLHFVDRSFQDEDQVKRFDLFSLDLECEKMPAHYEMVFITKGNRYRYGFEITENRVSAEWLFGRANTNEVKYFTRLGDKITINKGRFKEGAELPPDKTKSSTLFLNVVDAFNGPIAKEVKSFLTNSIRVNAGANDHTFRTNTLRMMEVEVLRKRIAELMRSADMGIEDIDHLSLDNLEIDGDQHLRRQNTPEKENTLKLLGTMKKVKNEPAGSPPTFFDFDNFESEGTKKFFSYSGPIIESLLTGTALVVDELDSRLHPSLTRKIVELFNSRELNPKNAQLIFVAHDINLLDPTLLRRDQIYFTEKNTDGETSLFSLINIGGVRNDVSYEREYMKGKYGALPYLSKFNVQLDEPHQEDR